MRLNLKRSKAFTAVIFLTGAGLFAPSSLIAQTHLNQRASTPTVDIFDTGASPDWRKDSGSLYSAFRSNSPHFWNWLKKESSTALFKPEGIVTGDPHVMNLADIRLQNGKLGFGLVDVDDAGNGSLLGDYLRFYIGNKISPYQVKGKELFAAYVQGMRGQELPKPAYWVRIQNVSQAQFEADQLKYIQDMLKKDGVSFKKEAAVKPMQEASIAIQKVFVAAQNDFKNEMQGYNILTMGFKVKEGGGSQDLPRFVYLLEKDKKKYVWEFKLEAAPAVSLYSTQPRDAATRMKQVEDIYRPSQSAMGPYKILQAGSGIFLLREKIEKYTRFSQENNESPIEVHEAQEMSLYIANQMGHWQIQQSEGEDLLKLIEQDNEAVFEHLKNLSKDYIQLMEREHGQK